MLVKEPKINKGQTESNNTRKPISGIRKSHFRFLLFIFLLTFLGILGVYFAQKNETTEPEKLRFQVLKNKCLRGERLSDEEKTEFCTLMKNNAPEQFVGVDCEKLPEQLYQAHLDEFLRKNRECAELLENEAKKNGFATEIQNTDNFKGLLIRIFSDKITVTIRLMHRSSGHVKHRTDKNYMRIHVFSQSSFFVDKNGVPNQDIEQNHIPFENCEDARAVFKNLMNEIQKKHEKHGYR